MSTKITEEQIEEIRRQGKICAIEWAKAAGVGRLAKGVLNWELSEGDIEFSMDEAGVDLDTLSDKNHDLAMDTLRDSWKDALKVIQDHVDDFTASDTLSAIREDDGLDNAKKIEKLENDELSA